MTDHLTPEREYELSRRFDADGLPQDELERQVFSTYRRLRLELMNVRLPDLNAPELAHTLQAEYQQTHRRRFFLPYLLIWKPAYAGTLVLFIAFLLVSLLPVRQEGKASPIMNYRVTDNTGTGSYEWLCEIENRETISISAPLQLTLTDGSQVQCSPPVVMSIDMENRRTVHLTRGKIRLNVEPMPNADFIVQTPLLEVTVVGTVFEVEVIR